MVGCTLIYSHTLPTPSIGQQFLHIKRLRKTIEIIITIFNTAVELRKHKFTGHAIQKNHRQKVHKSTQKCKGSVKVRQCFPEHVIV